MNNTTKAQLCEKLVSETLYFYDKASELDTQAAELRRHGDAIRAINSEIYADISPFGGECPAPADPPKETDFAVIQDAVMTGRPANTKVTHDPLGGRCV